MKGPGASWFLVSELKIKANCGQKNSLKCVTKFKVSGTLHHTGGTDFYKFVSKALFLSNSNMNMF